MLFRSGKIRPFDFFFTFNQTYDEKKMKDKRGRRTPRLRIYVDKAREYDSGQTIPIITNFSRARFYDKVRTLSMIPDFDEDDNE